MIELSIHGVTNVKSKIIYYDKDNDTPKFYVRIFEITTDRDEEITLKLFSDRGKDLLINR